MDPLFTRERVARALREMLEQKPGRTYREITEKSAGKLNSTKVSEMLSGKSLTLENVDALLTAMGYSWSYLESYVRALAGGKPIPGELREGGPAYEAETLLGVLVRKDLEILSLKHRLATEEGEQEREEKGEGQ